MQLLFTNVSAHLLRKYHKKIKLIKIYTCVLKFFFDIFLHFLEPICISITHMTIKINYYLCTLIFLYISHGYMYQNI